jgi:hypothetical protein
MTVFEAGNNFQLQHNHKEARKYYDRCLPYVLELSQHDRGLQMQRVLRDMAAVYTKTNDRATAGRLLALLPATQTASVN